jgi:hypothetical protein
VKDQRLYPLEWIAKYPTLVGDNMILFLHAYRNCSSPRKVNRLDSEEEFRSLMEATRDDRIKRTGCYLWQVSVINTAVQSQALRRS